MSTQIAVTNQIDIKSNSIFIWNVDKYCNKYSISKYKIQFLNVHGLYNTGTNALFSLLFPNCYGLELPLAIAKHMKPSYYESITKQIQLQNETYFKTVSWGKFKHDMIKSENNLQSKDKKSIEEYMHSLHVVLIKDPLTWFKSICKMSYGIHFLRQNWNWKNRDKQCLKSLSSISSSTNSILLFHKNIFLSIIELWNAYYSSWLNGDFTINENGNLYALYGAKNDKELMDLFNKNDSFILEHYQNAMRYKPQSDIPHIMIKFEDLLFSPHIIGPKVCQCVGGIWNSNFVVTNDSAKTHGKSRNRSQLLQIYANKTYRYHQYTSNALEFVKKNLNQTILNLFAYQW